MKNPYIRRFLPVAVLFLYFSAAAAVGESITVVNRTGTDIDLIQVAPSGSESWGDDLIPYQVVADGESTVLDLTGPAPYSIRLMDMNGVVYALYEVMPGRTGKIFVGPENRAELSALAGAERQISITNQTGNTITSLRISPVNDSVWGENLLSGRVILRDDTMDFILHTVPGILNFDMRFTLLSGNREIPYEKNGVILTDGVSLVLRTP